MFKVLYNSLDMDYVGTYALGGCSPAWRDIRVRGDRVVGHLWSLTTPKSQYIAVFLLKALTSNSFDWAFARA